MGIDALVLVVPRLCGVSRICSLEDLIETCSQPGRTEVTGQSIFWEKSTWNLKYQSWWLFWIIARGLCSISRPLVYIDCKNYNSHSKLFISRARGGGSQPLPDLSCWVLRKTVEMNSVGEISMTEIVWNVRGRKGRGYLALEEHSH